jgi:hypothetical protein
MTLKIVDHLAAHGGILGDHEEAKRPFHCVDCGAIARLEHRVCVARRAAITRRLLGRPDFRRLMTSGAAPEERRDGENALSRCSGWDIS